MTNQLDLDLDLGSGARPARAGLRVRLAGARRRAARFLVQSGEWACAWVPALLALQIAALGLVPVLFDTARLARAGREVRERETRLLAESQVLERERLMLEDPTWRARELKSDQDLDGQALELSVSRLRSRPGS